MKKITLLLVVAVFATTFLNAQSIECTGMRLPGQSTFMTPADFKTFRTVGGTAGVVEIGETIECEITHSNLPDTNGMVGMARIVVRYAKDGGSVAVGFNSINVPSGAAETTDVIGWVVGDPASANNPEPAVFQTFVAQNFGSLSQLISGFNVVPGGTLSTNNFSKDKLDSFYSASRDAIIMKDNLQGDFTIYNLMGQSVLDGGISREINVASLKTGLYILTTDLGSLKFVK